MHATVCPHDTVKGVTAWVELFVVLEAICKEDIDFFPVRDFPQFYQLWPQMDLIYANPLDAFKLEEEHGFLPVAGNNRYDEIVFLVREGMPSSLESFENARVGTVPGVFVTFLAQDILRKAGVRPAELVPFKSWGEVFAALKSGQITHAFLYRDYYDGLTAGDFEGTTTVLISNTRLFSHIFLLSPRQKEKGELFLSVFRSLPSHPMAQPALEALKITQFYPVESTQVVRELVTSG